MNDGSRSTAIAIQVEVANHSKLLYSKGMVVSVREKSIINWQVCAMEMNESEPFIKYQERNKSYQNKVIVVDLG